MKIKLKFKKICYGFGYDLPYPLKCTCNVALKYVIFLWPVQILWSILDHCLKIIITTACEQQKGGLLHCSQRIFVELKVSMAQSKLQAMESLAVPASHEEGTTGLLDTISEDCVNKFHPSSSSFWLQEAFCLSLLLDLPSTRLVVSQICFTALLCRATV